MPGGDSAGKSLGGGPRWDSVPQEAEAAVKAESCAAEDLCRYSALADVIIVVSKDILPRTRSGEKA